MDLGTIKTNIDKGYYTQKDDLMADIQLVWNNAKKFNRPGHFVHEGAKFLESFAHGRIDKIKRDGPHSISRPIAPLPPPREQSKRDARKKSLDLPGETQLPQHLEQNRNATGSMRACETLLRNLMTLKQHRVSMPTYLCTYFNLPYKTCFLFATYTDDTLGPNHVKNEMFQNKRLSPLF